MDPKRMVREGYDRLGDRLGALGSEASRQTRARYLGELLASVPAGARVLELGCGTGARSTPELAARFRLVGVDISPVSLAAARRNLPDAAFVCADMATLGFRPESFDAVAAFYSIIHLPREEHATLFGAIASWLKPGGRFVASLGARDNPDGTEADWLGVPMYWSHFDSATNLRLLEEAGLRVLSAQEETQLELGEPATHLWIVAEKQMLT